MDPLLVVLEGETAGEITADSGGLRFAYSTGRRGSTASTPLSLSMPLDRGEHPDELIRPWLEGLMPQDPVVLGRWGRRVGLAGPMSPVRLLATRVGWDCAGAVQFCPPGDLAAMQARPAAHNPASRAEVAAALRAAIADVEGPGTTKRSAPAPLPNFSLAGGQPKIALAGVEGRWFWPSGAAPSTHILKPAPDRLPEQAANEHLCLATARRLGLSAAGSTLDVFEELSAVVVERYDRVRGHDGVRRLHQEDICQALGRPPSAAAEVLGGPSTVHITELLRRHGSNADDVWTVVDRLALTWAIGLIDGHGKNTSLLLDGDEVTLAPLYDIATMLPYDPTGAETYLSMHVGDQPLNALIWRGDWEHHAGRLGLPTKGVLERVTRIVEETAPAAEQAAAACTEVAAGTFPERFAAAVADWQKHCLDALVTAPRLKSRPGPDSPQGLSCLA